MWQMKEPVWRIEGTVSKFFSEQLRATTGLESPDSSFRFFKPRLPGLSGVPDTDENQTPVYFSSLFGPYLTDTSVVTIANGELILEGDYKGSYAVPGGYVTITPDGQAYFFTPHVTEPAKEDEGILFTLTEENGLVHHVYTNVYSAAQHFRLEETFSEKDPVQKKGESDTQPVMHSIQKPESHENTHHHVTKHSEQFGLFESSKKESVQAEVFLTAVNSKESRETVAFNVALSVRPKADETLFAELDVQGTVYLVPLNAKGKGILIVPHKNFDDPYCDANAIQATVLNILGGNTQYVVPHVSATAHVYDTKTVTQIEIKPIVQADTSGFALHSTNPPDPDYQGATEVLVSCAGTTHAVLLDADGNGFLPMAIPEDRTSLSAKVLGVRGGNFESVASGAKALLTLPTAFIELQAEENDESILIHCSLNDGAVRSLSFEGTGGRYCLTLDAYGHGTLVLSKNALAEKEFLLSDVTLSVVESDMRYGTIIGGEIDYRLNEPVIRPVLSLVRDEPDSFTLTLETLPSGYTRGSIEIVVGIGHERKAVFLDAEGKADIPVPASCETVTIIGLSGPYFIDFPWKEDAIIVVVNGEEYMTDILYTPIFSHSLPELLDGFSEEILQDIFDERSGQIFTSNEMSANKASEASAEIPAQEKVIDEQSEQGVIAAGGKEEGKNDWEASLPDSEELQLSENFDNLDSLELSENLLFNAVPANLADWEEMQVSAEDAGLSDSEELKRTVLSEMQEERLNENSKQDVIDTLELSENLLFEEADVPDFEEILESSPDLEEKLENNVSEVLESQIFALQFPDLSSDMPDDDSILEDMVQDIYHDVDEYFSQREQETECKNDVAEQKLPEFVAAETLHDAALDDALQEATYIIERCTD